MSGQANVTLRELTQADAERFELALQPGGAVIDWARPFALRGMARLLRAAIAADWLEAPAARAETVTDQQGRSYTRFMLGGEDVDDLTPEAVFRLGSRLQALWLGWCGGGSTAAKPGDGPVNGDEIVLKEALRQRDVEAFERELEAMGGTVFPLGQERIDLKFSLLNYGRLARAAIAAGWVALPEAVVETVQDGRSTRREYRLGGVDVSALDPAERVVQRLGDAAQQRWLSFITLPNG